MSRQKPNVGEKVPGRHGIPTIGLSGIGNLTMSNGTVSSDGLFIGAHIGSQGTLTIEGGTYVVLGMFVSPFIIGDDAGATGTLWLKGGSLRCLGNAGAIIGFSGVGRMTVSNGTWLVPHVEVGFDTGSQGTLTIAGGTNLINSLHPRLNVGTSAGVSGTMWMTGGFLSVSNVTDSLVIVGGSTGTGAMTQSNGTFLSRNIWISYNNGSGTFNMAGGTNSVYGSLIVGSNDCVSLGRLNVSGGFLFVTNAAGNALLDMGGGTVTLSGGLLQADRIVMTNTCAHFVRTGGTLIYGSAVLTSNRDDDADGIPNGYEQSHGLDPLNPADASLDSDGDGQTSLAEFQSGTDATNSLSSLRITAITKESNDIRVTWMMGSGKTNALQRTAGGAGGSYSNNFADIFTVTNTTGTVTNYLDLGAATNVPAFYYRVRLVP